LRGLKWNWHSPGTVIAGNMGAEDRLNYTVWYKCKSCLSDLFQSYGCRFSLVRYAGEPNVKDLFDVEKLDQ